MRSIYELWMEQSKDFFSTSDKYLKSLFAEHKTVNPEEHLEHIQTWMNMMKQQWQMAQAAHEYKDYWNTMTHICNDAADLMLEEWRRSMRDKEPVQNIQELYQLWLNCCHEIYQRSVHTQAFQDSYGEFMNRAFYFWKNAVPTN